MYQSYNIYRGFFKNIRRRDLLSIGELVSSPTIGHDLHVVYMQIWFPNIFCLAEIHIQRWDKKVWKVCDWLYHLVCGWLWMLQPFTMHTLPRTNSSIFILQLIWGLIVEEVYKIYCSNIEWPIIREVHQSPESRPISVQIFPILQFFILLSSFVLIILYPYWEGAKIIPMLRGGAQI